MRAFIVVLALLFSHCANAQVSVARTTTEPTIACNAYGPTAAYEAKLPSWFAAPGAPAKIMAFRLWSELSAGSDYWAGTNGQFGIGIDPGQRYAKAASFPPNQFVNPTFSQGLGALRFAPGNASFYFAEFPTPYSYAVGDGIAVAPTCNGSAFPLQIYWTIIANMPAFPTQCPDTTSLMINGDLAGVTDSSGRAYVLMEQGIITPSNVGGQDALFYNGGFSNLRITGNGTFSTDFQWNTPRTLQTWIYPTDATIDISYRHIASGGAGATAPAMAILNTNQIGIGNETAVILTSSATCALNAWCHIAWTYDTVNSCLYVGGVSQGCVSDTTPYNTAAFYVGRYGGALQGRFKGYMQNFQLSIGVQYTGTFTPSHTDPLFGGPRC